MCISNNFIEQQAYIISKRIIKNSIYKPVKLDIIGGKSIEIEEFISQDSLINRENPPLITKIILANNDGLHFSVEPNEYGLSYSKGEITYKEYKNMENKESRRFILYFFLLSSGFFLLCLIISSWLFI